MKFLKKVTAILESTLPSVCAICKSYTDKEGNRLDLKWQGEEASHGLCKICEEEQLAQLEKLGKYELKNDDLSDFDAKRQERLRRLNRKNLDSDFY